MQEKGNTSVNKKREHKEIENEIIIVYEQLIIPIYVYKWL